MGGDNRHEEDAVVDLLANLAVPAGIEVWFDRSELRRGDACSKRLADPPYRLGEILSGRSQSRAA